MWKSTLITLLPALSTRLLTWSAIFASVTKQHARLPETWQKAALYNAEIQWETDQYCHGVLVSQQDGNCKKEIAWIIPMKFLINHCNKNDKIWLFTGSEWMSSGSERFFVRSSPLNPDLTGLVQISSSEVSCTPFNHTDITSLKCTESVITAANITRREGVG